MENTPIPRLILKLSMPVMTALLIQSLYNIIDSYFIAKDSQEGLTALSILFPVQLLMTALAVGTGAGINILISRLDGQGNAKHQNTVVKCGLCLGIVNFLCFALAGMAGMEWYLEISSDQAAVRQQGIEYARIIFLFSFGLFLESNCTKILQARGNMMTPMSAQVTGAVINVILDPILIFGKCGFPPMGIRGAAIATVIGQCGAMIIVVAAVLRKYSLRDAKLRWTTCVDIYREGLPCILMQSLYTLYIVGLNLILKQFTEDAVTVLGIYYKLQTFFFIPLMGLEQVILPVISYNYGAGRRDRIRETLRFSVLISCSVMAVAMAVFFAAPDQLLSLFSQSEGILSIGGSALRIIAVSFIPAGISMMYTVYFQGMGRGGASMFVTILRQVILLVPLAWLFHFAGLWYVWLTFPVTEVITAACCWILSRRKV